MVGGALTHTHTLSYIVVPPPLHSSTTTATARRSLCREATTAAVARKERVKKLLLLSWGREILRRWRNDGGLARTGCVRSEVVETKWWE